MPLFRLQAVEGAVVVGCVTPVTVCLTQWRWRLQAWKMDQQPRAPSEGTSTQVTHSETPQIQHTKFKSNSEGSQIFKLRIGSNDKYFNKGILNYLICLDFRKYFVKIIHLQPFISIIVEKCIAMIYTLIKILTTRTSAANPRFSTGLTVWLLLCQHKLESSGKEGASLRRLLHQMVCGQGRKGTLLVDDYWGRAQPSRAVPAPSRWAGGQRQPWAAV